MIDACTQGSNVCNPSIRIQVSLLLAALEDDPHYVKALQRRAAAGEKTDSWSSLARAEEGEHSHARRCL